MCQNMEILPYERGTLPQLLIKSQFRVNLECRAVQKTDSDLLEIPARSVKHPGTHPVSGQYTVCICMGNYLQRITLICK